MIFLFFFSSRRRHTRCSRDWSSDVCSSDLSSTAGTSSARSRRPISGSGTATRTARLADASYPTASVTRPSALRRVRVADALVGYLFVSPLCVLVLGLVAYPLGNAVWISLTDKYVGYAPRFVGLANYAALARDPIFHKVVWNSAVFTLASVAVKVVLGMLMALALQRALVARSFLRAVLLVPWVIPTVITALTWHWMFNALWGLINVTLQGVGLQREPIAWLGQPATAMAAVITANASRGFPFFGASVGQGGRRVHVPDAGDRGDDRDRHALPDPGGVGGRAWRPRLRLHRPPAPRRRRAVLLDGEHLAEDLRAAPEPHALLLPEPGDPRELQGAPRNDELPDLDPEQRARRRRRHARHRARVEPRGLQPHPHPVSRPAALRDHRAHRLPRPADPALHPALYDPQACRPGEQPLGAPRGVPDVHGSVLHLAPDGILPLDPARPRGGGDGGRRHAARRVPARDPPAHDAGHPGGRALRIHPGVERVPLRPRLRARHRAEDDPGGPERPDVRRHFPVGPADGGGRRDDPAGDRALHLSAALHGRGPHGGRRQGVARIARKLTR